MKIFKSVLLALLLSFSLQANAATIPQNIARSNAPAIYREIWTQLNDQKQTNELNEGDFLIGNSSDIATARTISGDATISSLGALTIANGAIDLSGAKVTGILPNTKTTAEEFNAGGNTAFSIASRNNFGELSANFANVSTVTTLIPVAPDSSNNTRFPIFANTSGPSLTANSLANSNLTFNPSTGALSSTSFIGSLTGNASTVTTNANLTGDVTSTGNATTIATNIVGNSKFRQSAGSSVVGRSTNTTGNVADIAASSDSVLNSQGGTVSFTALPLANAAMTTGILPINKGGSGTGTAFTPGSVISAGPSGIYSEDFSGINYNATTNRLALNKASVADFTLESVGAIAVTDGAPGISAKQMAMGYDTVNDWGTLSSIHQGVATTPIKATTPNFAVVTGDISIETVGKGLQVKSAPVVALTANATLVTGVVLVGGTRTISNSSITASHVGFATRITNGGVTQGSYRVTCGAGTFTVQSSSGLDASTLAVFFILPT